ncbi:hypothetical protein SRHO_G00101120 [Serrasalmus rhombeus]
MAEAGCRVQPNLSRFTVASVIRAFTEENRIERRPNMILFLFFQRVLELDASAVPYEYIFIDEAGFNLHKIRRRGRNIIGNRAIVNVPGHRGGNITMCAAIGPRGVIHHHAQLGPYNTPRLVSFLDELKNLLNLPQEEEPEQPSYVVIWDNVSFLWSMTGSLTIHNLLCCTFHHIPHFSIQSRNSFLHGGGKCTNADPTSVWHYFRQWRRHEMTSTQMIAKDGFAMQGVFSPAVWRGRKLQLM